MRISGRIRKPDVQSTMNKINGLETSSCPLILLDFSIDALIGVRMTALHNRGMERVSM